MADVVTNQAAPAVSIIVVNYRTRQMTLECLRSVVSQTQHLSYEIILVDNSNDSGLHAELVDELARVRLIVPAENVGFARANNIGADQACGKYLLLLNPDTLILDRAIERLVEFAERLPDAKIWGGRTLFADHSLNSTSCWRRMTLWNVFCRTSGLAAAFPRSRIFNSEAYGGWDRSSERRVDIVTGCFLLIGRDVWRTLGGFDAKFFMYGEEADLCLRARRLGARPAVTPLATIVHYGGASEQTELEKSVRLLAAKAELIQRHWAPPKRQIGLLIYAAMPLTRALAIGVLDRSFNSQRGAAWWQIWRHRDRWRNGYVSETG